MTNTAPYQVCTRCVMDTSTKEIVFDDQGVCNFCTTFLENSGHILHMPNSERDHILAALVEKVKHEGVGKPYDCIIGVSGGVDSSWALLKAVELGLRPLAVHMDNGWNTEAAQHNISNLVRGLGVDLYTYVIDWNEYRKLMQAFFDADVIDIELLYDNAMFAVNFRQAAKHKVKYILSGTNSSTEGIPVPKDWNWFKYDKKNIKSIARSANVSIKTFPAIGTLSYIWYEFVMGIHWTAFLDFFNYNKSEALDTLQRRFGYKPYPYKHYESIFTRFYQGYILPEKVNVDKRKLHFSTMVMSGQISRQAALADLEKLAYPTENDLAEDKRYFIKKMLWSENQLVEYINRPEKPHDTYPTEKPLFDRLLYFYRRFIRHQH